MPLLVLLFIVVPLAELYVIIEIGQAIGLLPTLAILLGDALLGSFLLRQQGRSAWRRFNEAIAAQRFPGREAADGVMIAVGGALLLTPGFITDIAGLALLLPPTRALIRRAMWGVLRRRFVVTTWQPPPGAPHPPGPAGGYDFEGTATEADRPAGAIDPPPSGREGPR